MSTANNPQDASVAAADPLALRWHGPGLAIAACMVLATIVITSTQEALSVRDTDRMLSGRMLLLVGAVAFFLTLDTLPRALRRPGPWYQALAGVLRERWTRRRALVVLLGFVSFYITYLSYRNLKSFVPFLTHQNLDPELLRLDRSIFFGHDPGPLLHDLLGTGMAAHLLSTVYLFFLAFVPISLGAALIAATNPRPGLWYVTALGLNWAFGLLSYLVLPSLGPIFAAPDLYSSLPDTGVYALQQALVQERLEMLTAGGAVGVQSIAAFASLHVSVIFTAALIAHLLRLARVLRYALWAFLALTVLATLYFGWHYVIDDLAAFVLAPVAVVVSGVATGHLSMGVTPSWRVRLPNALTLLRIATVPVIVGLLLAHGGDSLAAAVLFALASATDLLDGHLARRWRQVSVFGTLADPLADKLLVLGSLAALAAVDRVALWVVLAIAAREVWVTFLRARAKRSGTIIPASPLGKAKMCTQATAVLALIIVAPHTLWVDLLVYATAAITIASGVDHWLRARSSARPARVAAALP